MGSECMSGHTVLAIECFATDLAAVDKMSSKVDGLNMTLDVGFVRVCFATRLASPLSSFSKPLNVLFKYAGVGI